MSEREVNDEYGASNFELGGLGGDATRNRPAAGATFAESTQELNLDWKGSSAATDFLGIEGDTRGDSIPAPIGSGLDTSGTAGLPADSWLHGIEGRDDEAAEVAAAATAAKGAASKTHAHSALEAIREKATRKSGGLLTKLVAACVVIALAGGGAWYWKKHMAGSTPPVEVATNPAPTKPPQKKPVPTPTNPTGVVATNPTGVTPTNTDPLVPGAEPTATTTDDPAVVVVTETTIELPPFEPVAPTVTFPSSTEPVSVTSAKNPSAHPTAVPVSLPTNLRVPPSSTTPLPGAVRRATEEDFANLWREQSVPMEAITGERKLRTVNVGQVRVMLDSGEYFEGALYAVGQKRVWLDLTLGRIAFEAAVVRDITRIAAPASSIPIGKKGADLSGLPHVEVRLPGGWMAGRLVGREGDKVTLVTDDGIRMVIETDEVRPLTAHKTRVLGSVEKLGGFTGKPVQAAQKP